MINTNLKKLRILKNLTQEQLAKLLCVSFKTISHWESGYSTPSLEMLKKIKNTLNVTYEELLDD